MLSGYPTTVLFDTGSQVSIIDKQWAKTHIPNYTVRPLQELLEDEVEVVGMGGQVIPYEGWVELTVNLTGNDDPDLTIQTPFLVSQLPLIQPIVGANVLEEIIHRRESSKDDVRTVISLLCSAFAMEEDQVMAMVHSIQVPQKPDRGPVTVRIGRSNIVIPPRKAVDVWCRVPPNLAN